MFKIDSISGVTVNSTVFFSPCLSVMRSKPFNCITGCVTEATFWCTYNCGTSSPARWPVFVISTLTFAVPPDSICAGSTRRLSKRKVV
jgi:hypothetical protein